MILSTVFLELSKTLIGELFRVGMLLTLLVSVPTLLAFLVARRDGIAAKAATDTFGSIVYDTLDSASNVFARGRLRCSAMAETSMQSIVKGKSRLLFAAVTVFFSGLATVIAALKVTQDLEALRLATNDNVAVSLLMAIGLFVVNALFGFIVVEAAGFTVLFEPLHRSRISRVVAALISLGLLVGLNFFQVTSMSKARAEHTYQLDLRPLLEERGRLATILDRSVPEEAQEFDRRVKILDEQERGLKRRRVHNAKVFTVVSAGLVLGDAAFSWAPLALFALTAALFVQLLGGSAFLLARSFRGAGLLFVRLSSLWIDLILRLVPNAGPRPLSKRRHHATTRRRWPRMRSARHKSVRNRATRTAPKSAQATSRRVP
jgi:hypothetical protein